MDPREIANQLTSRGASDECVVCGGHMTVIQDVRVPQAGYGLLAMDDEKIHHSKALSVAALACTTCGWVRLHSTGVLSGAIAEQLGENDGESA
jgi:hypothetical protein